MITSYFTDPLEKTDSRQKTHPGWGGGSWWKHSVVLSVIQYYTEKHLAETPDETEPKFPETQQRS